MRHVLHLVLTRLVRRGRLTVHWPDGPASSYGDGSGPAAGMRLADARTIWRLVANPSLAVGEAYMEGKLVPVGCDVRALLDVLILNLVGEGSHPGQKLQAALRRTARRLRPGNSTQNARRNVAHHYDLDHRFYRLLLDADMQYSCAYFETGQESLDAAQTAKKRLVARKLLLDRPGLRVLDIGCGWGGLAMTLARDYGARVTGVTLSREQLDVARARAAEAGLDGTVSFELLDYRAVQGVFDRVVSVGMFEHVGTGNYPAFFATLQRCLTPDGVCLLHSIGNSGPPSFSNAWLTKYVFPGGYSPSLSEVFPHAERAGLIATDMEVLRLHYATTLARWQERFSANRRTIARMYDERFCRMFEFYLAGCELAFRYQGEMVFQLQLARSQAAVPLTRRYLATETAPASMPAAARVRA